MAINRAHSLLLSFFVAILLLVPSFILAANSYGDCAYGNESYNTNCPDAVESTSVPRKKNEPKRAPALINIFTSAAKAAISFSRSLAVGARGGDVLVLQKFLNANGFTVALSGPGSAGHETEMFGSATKAALVKFQLAKGIVPASGYFGPLTRAAINAPGTLAAPGAPAAASGAFSRTLGVGDSGADVLALQKILNSLGFTVAASGPGSLGQETDFYGRATREAVKKFQEAYASEILAPSGMTAGNGLVGPRTREKLNSLK